MDRAQIKELFKFSIVNNNKRFFISYKNLKSVFEEKFKDNIFNFQISIDPEELLITFFVKNSKERETHIKNVIFFIPNIKHSYIQDNKAYLEFRYDIEKINKLPAYFFDEMNSDKESNETFFYFKDKKFSLKSIQTETIYSWMVNEKGDVELDFFNGRDEMVTKNLSLLSL